MRYAGPPPKGKPFLHISTLLFFLAPFFLFVFLSNSFITVNGNSSIPPPVAPGPREPVQNVCTTPHVTVDRDGPQPVSFLNDRARDMTGAAAVNVPGFVVPEGLTGEGQIVAIADSGLDAGRTDDIHPDLHSQPGKMPKVVLLKSWAGRAAPDDPDGHGTHMAATIAGTGAASGGRFRGVAPGASLYFQAILNADGKPEPPANLEELFEPAYSAGARVHVDGWGGGANTYLKPAAQVDEFVREHPDFLVVFGAGNSGPSSGTLTAEANSKNALTVGASNLPRPAFVPGADDPNKPADFSSRGPAGDGRIKPELLAPASALISARSRLVEGNLPGYPEYTRLQGTSMAAAVAGGTSALLREYFKKHMQIKSPSAALVKAALINGARTGAGGPSKDGFGVIDLAGTVIALKEGTFKLADEWAGVSQGSEVSYTVKVSDSSVPFKATLTWTDPTGNSGSARALVNDLDLVVRAPDGSIYYGNHFMGKNAPDKINNVEQVYLPAPLPGEYTVRVAGAGIRENTVRASRIPLQDFALVWGQSPVESTLKKTEGQQLTLEDGTSFSQGSVPVVKQVNDRIFVGDVNSDLIGAAVFRSPERAYLVARRWQASGVSALKTSEGFIFTELNSLKRLGGYRLAQDAGEVLLNNRPAAPERLPPGVYISAVLNPLEQNLRNVRAAYAERQGVISSVQHKNGQKLVSLAGDPAAYLIMPDAVYSYEDRYANTETSDMPFGTGALEEMEEILPGMPVRLHLMPSGNSVQYLALKRTVALGTVAEASVASGEVRMENGDAYRVLPGAPVKRDREEAALRAIQPGDHISAVLLTDTEEALGLVAYSIVVYGKVIDFTVKNRTLYLLDESGHYRSYSLPADAVIYRWGVRTTMDAIATGCWVRITTDPSGKEIWRLDIAESFDGKGTLKKYDNLSGLLRTAEDGKYRISASTRFSKNGFPVAPEDFIPGEQLEIEYAVAPPPTGNVLLSVNARSFAPPPLLFASAVPLQDRLLITGRTGTSTSVYIWREGYDRETIPVDGSGKFALTLPWKETGENQLDLVAVDQKSGGVEGRQVVISQVPENGGAGDTVMKALAAVLGDNLSVLPDRTGGHRPGVPITRAEAVNVLAQLLNWPDASEWPLPFADAQEISAAYRLAVAEAGARGIIRGYSDGSFLASSPLTRAEAAVLLAAVMHDLGLKVHPVTALRYNDAGDIPGWAEADVAETSAAGIFRDGQAERFAPEGRVTVTEMAELLHRLLVACERYSQ